ncbi:MAG: hypothetical protein HY883_04200 [Deltaproteobacteria bacterium]|nr:hypothetical protein [Deltaproteobacteria bacterium]
MKVNKAVYGFISPAAGREMRLKAAQGEVPLKPADRLTAVYVLAHDKDGDIRAAAQKTFAGFPADEIILALENTLDPAVIRDIAKMHPANEGVLIKIALTGNADDETLKTIAAGAPRGVDAGAPRGVDAGAPEKVLKAIAKNAGSVSPQGVSSVVKNPVTQRELSGRAGKPHTTSEFPREFTEKRTKEMEEGERINMQRRIMSMTVAEKIKLALLGNKEAREILIKDSNKMVSFTVLGNPHITEDEIIKLTASTSTSDELLRLVVRNKEWLKSYHIRKNLIYNPKTPMKTSLRIIPDLNERDLEKLAKSKNVPSVIASSARKALMMKKKR